MYEMAMRAAKEGFQVATHAIGDAAVHQVLVEQGKVIKELGLKDHRFRVEHLQIVAPGDFMLAKDEGFIPSMQPTHATSDMYMAQDRIGPDRIKRAYAWKTVLNDGMIIAAGSDAPFESANPWWGMYAAITRKAKDLSKQPKGWPDGWYPDQKMTREQALKAFTIWGAYAQFGEKVKGSLEPGKYADFTVIDRDVMTCPENQIKDVQALCTVIGGKVVYQKSEKK
jgi:predicted amidohydrolase YtcJ